MAARLLNVELRKETGKNSCNRIRSKGFVPGVLYSHGKTEMINFQRKDFLAVFKGHISESVLLDLKITNKTDDNNPQAFVKDYQVDPVTSELVHVDFFKITAGEKIHTMVPLEVTGTPEGVRMGGILEIFERELNIECLPKDMPEKIVINVEKLKLNESLHVKDVQLGDAIKFITPADKILAAVVVPHVEKEPVAVEAAAEAVEGETVAAKGDEKAGDAKEGKADKGK